jgi:hypothetical protein
MSILSLPLLAAFLNSAKQCKVQSPFILIPSCTLKLHQCRGGLRPL